MFFTRLTWVYTHGPPRLSLFNHSSRHGKAGVALTNLVRKRYWGVSLWRVSRDTRLISISMILEGGPYHLWH